MIWEKLGKNLGQFYSDNQFIMKIFGKNLGITWE